MERVAEQAGISKPVLYSHFGKSAEVLVALLEEFWASLDVAVREKTVRGEPFETRLEAIVLCYFDVLDTQGRRMHPLVIRGSHEPIVEAARLERNRTIERLWAVQLAEEAQVPESMAATAAALIRSTIAAAGEHYLVSGDPRDVCIETCLIVIRGALKELQTSREGDVVARSIDA